MADFNLDELTDEELQQLMDLGIIPDQLGNLDKQMATAEALRYAEAPGVTSSRGGYTTAASPLEHLARVVGGIKGGKELNKLRGEQSDLLGKQVSGRTLFANKLRGKKKIENPIPTDLDSGYE